MSKENKQLKKDFKAVKRALEVFKDIERLDAVKVVVKNNKNTKIHINLGGVL
jgi:hypothetical protein